MKPYDELTLTDDFLFSKILQDEDICKELIELLLDVKIGKIEYISNQNTINEDPFGRGVRLDVYVKDSERIFDIEMQTINKKDLSLRSRYYQSLMDIDNLRKGQKFTQLRESYVIFICTFDPFNKDNYKYTFTEHCIEFSDLYLNDKTWKVFYNINAYEKSTNKNVQSFLRYLATKKAESIFTKKLDKAVFTAKGKDPWRASYMTLGMKYDEWREEGLEEGRAEGRVEGKQQNQLETAKNFLKMNILTNEQIANGTGLSLQEVQKLQNSISTF